MQDFSSILLYVANYSRSALKDSIYMLIRLTDYELTDDRVVCKLCIRRLMDFRKIELQIYRAPKKMESVSTQAGIFDYIKK